MVMFAFGARHCGSGFRRRSTTCHESEARLTDHVDEQIDVGFCRTIVDNRGPEGDPSVVVVPT